MLHLCDIQREQIRAMQLLRLDIQVALRKILRSIERQRVEISGNGQPLAVVSVIGDLGTPAQRHTESVRAAT